MGNKTDKIRNYYRLVTSHMRALPHYVIMGAAKGGTTTIQELLNSHPNVQPTLSNATYYFDSPRYHKGTVWYRSHFPILPKHNDIGKSSNVMSVTGEYSTYYMFHPLAPRRMSELIPNAKLIVLLRNPVDRAYSFYQMQVRRNRETLGTFEEALAAEEGRLNGEVEKMVNDTFYESYSHRHFSYLTRGIYVNQLKALIEYYDRKQILILKSEEFFENTSSVFSRVLNFLELPEWHPEKYVASNVGRYLDMEPETRKRLEKFYASHNQRLYEFLERDFGW